ncbi:RadC family protein [Staphylococcus ratti]|uniref:DNA repair protein RadC n=1 Tax=Staphylococcus ratti TaxID=2892440 RepID=A0ABY3PFC3_9STAP|nr:DNA repair protein RadC [Staphylococcus ratti]UEX91013.1 DNA repair protein RadC [Staphylococcus ratti]
MTRIKDLSPDEMPKERLLQKGAKALSNTELLAILINTGSKGRSSLDIAARLLAYSRNLKMLQEMSLQELISFEGIGKSKSATLLAAFELAHRLNLRTDISPLSIIRKPAQIAELLYPQLTIEKQEKFIVFVLNTKHQIIHQETLFKGTLNSAIIHPREVFKIALKHSAHAIIVAHNHPSGDPTPSQADFDTTLRLQNCGETMGIQLLDHIVVGHQCFVSIIAKMEEK